MELFELPYTTQVNRVIPKNSFDAYTSSRQKKLFVDLIARITWIHKISPDTVNLEARQIQEIQVFRIELKVSEDISTLLEVIDRAIPYHIVFQVQHEGLVYLSTSVKHPHPVNEDKAVIDWTFTSALFDVAEGCPYLFRLKRSIDDVHKDFCWQLSGKKEGSDRSIEKLIEYQRNVATLTKEAEKLRSIMSKSKQFNQKVELNLRLKEVETELEALLII
jgi:hypothetical protein